MDSSLRIVFWMMDRVEKDVLVRSYNCIASKVPPPTLHIRIEVWLHEFKLEQGLLVLMLNAEHATWLEMTDR